MSAQPWNGGAVDAENFLGVQVAKCCLLDSRLYVLWPSIQITRYANVTVHLLQGLTANSKSDWLKRTNLIAIYSGLQSPNPLILKPFQNTEYR